MGVTRKEKAIIDGKFLTFKRLVPPVSGRGESVVLCSDEYGSECYVLESQWRDVAAPSDDVSPITESGCKQSSPQRAVTRNSPASDKIALYRSLFKGREDVYAHAFLKRDGKIGYAPVCTNDWKRGVCPRCTNPKAKCGDCEKRAFKPLDSSVLIKHFRGEDARCRDVLGLYVLDENCNTSVLVIDFDDGDWKQAAMVFRDVAAGAGLPFAVERSRSGEGCHVWFFFDEPLPAKLVREMGAALLTKATTMSRAVGFSSYDRMFPTQDSVPKGGLAG